MGCADIHVWEWHDEFGGQRAPRHVCRRVGSEPMSCRRAGWGMTESYDACPESQFLMLLLGMGVGSDVVRGMAWCYTVPVSSVAT